jgi:hypothetical protein
MPAATTELATLYRVRKGSVDIIDVPELHYLMVEGAGPPEGGSFASAVQALYSVSYAAHFALKKDQGDAPKVMPLEAQWWVGDPNQQDIVAAVALGQASMLDTDRERWCWRAMIVQPYPIDAATVDRAIRHARDKKDLPALDLLRYERWEEGRCAQLLHVGPYAAEGPSIVRLHEGIAAAGYRPRGRHHEIYLGDPRRSAPEKLRTILRHPVAPLDG